MIQHCRLFPNTTATGVTNKVENLLTSMGYFVLGFCLFCCGPLVAGCALLVLCFSFILAQNYFLICRVWILLLCMVVKGRTRFVKWKLFYWWFVHVFRVLFIKCVDLVQWNPISNDTICKRLCFFFKFPLPYLHNRFKKNETTGLLMTTWEPEESWS